MSDLIYTENRFFPKRRKTLEVKVGEVVIGGHHPILIQSMTTTNTRDISATVEQALQMARAGCELVRITAPTVKDSECLKEIVKKVRGEGCRVPFSADIHFQPKAAFEALKWVEKVRINPGNFVDTKTSAIKEYSDASFEKGVQKVFDAFGPLVREAKARGVCLRIGTNHGSLSDRILWKYGDTVEGMVESALEYLRVCEGENFDQVVFSMKSSNPRVVVQAYRLLAARLEREFKNYPFHVGVTEAGEGEDGRLKSAVGIGALLLDGIGDTIRVSLTENPVEEIPVAKELVRVCDLKRNQKTVPVIDESYLNFYDYTRRHCEPIELGPLTVGGRQPVAVGITLAPGNSIPTGIRKLEWATVKEPIKELAKKASLPIAVSGDDSLSSSDWRVVSVEEVKGVTSDKIEIQVKDVKTLDEFAFERKRFKWVLWSIEPSQDIENIVASYRYLSGWLFKKGLPDLIVLRGESSGSSSDNISLAAQMGSLLSDGIGDLIHIGGAIAPDKALSLGYDILQAAGARKSKVEYVSCPSCGRTLFDIEDTTQKIRQLTAHLNEVSIAIMGCIVNGPGEMADADFGYVGGAPNRVNLYVGRECIKRNIPEETAPEALVALIKESGKWKEPLAA